MSAAACAGHRAPAGAGSGARPGRAPKLAADRGRQARRGGCRARRRGPLARAAARRGRRRGAGAGARRGARASAPASGAALRRPGRARRRRRRRRAADGSGEAESSADLVDEGDLHRRSAAAGVPVDGEADAQAASRAAWPTTATPMPVASARSISAAPARAVLTRATRRRPARLISPITCITRP